MSKINIFPVRPSNQEASCGGLDPFGREGRTDALAFALRETFGCDTNLVITQSHEVTYMRVMSMRVLSNGLATMHTAKTHGICTFWKGLSQLARKFDEFHVEDRMHTACDKMPRNT